MQSLVVEPFGSSSGEDVVLDRPPDKSITHRALIFASMARGHSVIRRPLLGADCRSTMGVFSALGVKFHSAGGTTSQVQVESPGWDQWESPLTPLDFGNSGTTARLLTGVFAATPGLFVTAFGDESLSQRPMGRVIKPLKSMGALLTGRKNSSLLPLAIEGQRLEEAHHVVDKASAQVKSALILAGLNVHGTTTVTLPVGGRDHTEKMLEQLGASLTVCVRSGQETISVLGPFRPSPRVFEVPGDPSSAAFFMVLGALRSRGRITMGRVLVNPTRTGFLTVLRNMGAHIAATEPQQSQGLLEPVCDLTVFGGQMLHATETTPDMAPTMIDEIPILAVAAHFAKGVSRFRGLSELRVKESDRLQNIVDLLAVAGGRAWTEGDDLYVEGKAGHVGGFHYDPAKDHRLAMAAAVLAKSAKEPCTIADPRCVDVSFPGFFEALAAVAG